MNKELKLYHTFESRDLAASKISEAAICDKAKVLVIGNGIHFSIFESYVKDRIGQYAKTVEDLPMEKIVTMLITDPSFNVFFNSGGTINFVNFDPDSDENLNYVDTATATADKVFVVANDIEGTIALFASVIDSIVQRSSSNCTVDVVGEVEALEAF